MSLECLRALCVDKFPLSTSRVSIMMELETFLKRVFDIGVDLEVWINGSFLTEKMDPNDVDMVMRIASEAYDCASDGQLAALAAALQTSHDAGSCHAFVLVTYPESDPLHGEGEWQRAYWIRQFGFSRGQEMKGMALLRPQEPQ